MIYKLPPGSDEACKAGCSCAVLDNNYGRGSRGDGNSYWITATCKLHGIGGEEVPERSKKIMSEMSIKNAARLVTKEEPK